MTKQIKSDKFYKENTLGKLFLGEVDMKVLNFGSLNIDYVYKVNHFVKKGETISSDMLEVFEGGKGLNQSIALSRAGVKVYHAGAIGMDGMVLKEVLDTAGVDTRFIKVLDNIRTGNAIIQNDRQGDNCIVLYGGANQAITKEMVDMILSEFDKGDWLILQNEINANAYIAEQAWKRGMKIVLNPSPVNENILKINLDYIHTFILNEVEARALVGECSGEKVLLKKMRSKFSHAEIVLTLGEKGALYAGGNLLTEQEAYRVNAIDTTAAGDTFTGYYLAGRFQEMTVKESLDMAAKASAIAVSRKGAAPSIPQKAEMMEFKTE